MIAPSPPPARHRVLLVTSNLGGGTGTHLVGLLERWEPRRWAFHLHCHGPVELDPPANVELTRVSRRGALDRFPLAQLRRMGHLRREVRRHPPDLVHAYFFWPVVYARLLKRAGYVRHLVENREDEGFNMGERDFRILRRTAHLPDRVVCVSEAVRRVAVEREGVSPSRTVVIPNGVALPRTAAGKGERERLRAEVRQELGLDGEHRVVGMVANLNRAVKGVHHFVDAVPAIVEAVPEARFLVVGGGPDEDALRARARARAVAGHLHFTGFRPDIHRIYPAMDVSVLTSLSEGLSITLLESMGHGLPVVATRVGGNPELVRDGENGFLVPPADIPAFAERVVALLRDGALRQEMGTRGRALVESDFVLERVARRYEALYRSVIRGNGSP